MSEQPQDLAAASGAPRPLTVRPVRPAGPDSYVAPVIRLRPQDKEPAPEPAPHRAIEASEADEADELRRAAGTARSVAQACMEVIGGSRPVQQLARWLDPDCYDKLVHRAALAQERGARRASGRSALQALPSAVVRSARVCRIGTDVYEAALVVVEPHRARAVALRLERRRGLWKVTALEIG
ncbi:Rv3235 family protein [Arthrobacter sp. I2-34]|uniref:Rv3235 family protein n=1 Tax=Arthrobacter hankyongi TaxID=2904801 RepID=A0ABS9L7W7_9MICC|nr:Rv3235 family protein [Arthrobacter hankyongi]MCG2622730.1 Rv3235 family protein [Arthrobacter hankyongi]